MPHRCMNCGRVYEDDAEELVEGCECGSNLFMYESEIDEDDEEERDRVREEVEQLVQEGETDSEDIKLEFDIDSISVEEEGVYSINVSRLLEELPLVIRKREGVYHVHLPSAFEPEDADISEEML